MEKKEVGDDVEKLNKYSGRFSTQVSHNDEILFNYLSNGGITYYDDNAIYHYWLNQS